MFTVFPALAANPVCAHAFEIVQVDEDEDNQLQWVGSVRCGYYCLLFLDERNKGKSFKDILDMFSDNVHENERIVKTNLLLNIRTWMSTA